MATYFGTRGAASPTADEFRKRSGVSCIPGRDTPSGGLPINAVERTCAAYGVDIEYGRAASSYYRRWNSTEIRARLGTYWGGVLLGMYSSVKAPWRAHGSTFQGGHSTWAHDLRDDMGDSHDHVIQETVCWHDPLRARPIRVPWSVVYAYTQTNSSLKGFAGWVKIPPEPGAVYARPMLDRTRLRYDKLAVHYQRTTGAASTIRVIRDDGNPLVEIAMYADGEPYGSGVYRHRWGALSLIGNEWVHLNRLDHVHGDT